MIWVGLLTILGALPHISGLCYRPGDQANGRVFAYDRPYVNGRFPEGTQAFFICELGFGSRILHHPSVCQANGQWTQTARCEVTCPPLRLGPYLTYNTSLLDYGTFEITGYSVDTKVTFPCDETNPTEASSSMICQSSGIWGQQAPICNKTCDEPDIPANGSLHSTSKSRLPSGKYLLRTEVIFKNDTSDGTAFQHIFCQDGNWTELISFNAKCYHPPDPGNGTRIYINFREYPLVNGKYREGTKAYIFDCELGFGSKIMFHPSVCQANGQWTQYRCEVMCHPLNLVNGEATYNTTVLSEFGRRGYSVGTMATFSCDGEESGSVICQSSGNWSQPVPTCIAIPCLRPTVDNGFYEVLFFTPDKGFYNEVFFEYTILQFHCKPGYTLIDSLWPDLNSSMCLLNGTWHPAVPRCILQEV